MPIQSIPDPSVLAMTAFATMTVSAGASVVFMLIVMLGLSLRSTALRGKTSDRRRPFTSSARSLRYVR